MWKLFVVMAALAPPPAALAQVADRSISTSGEQVAPSMDAAHRAWFEGAVGHILVGPSSDVGRSSSGPGSDTPQR